MSVAMEGSKFKALVQYDGFSAHQVALEATPMRIAVAYRNDRLGQQLAEHLRAFPPESGFRLWTPAGDNAGSVNSDHSIERRLDDEARAFLAFPKAFLALKSGGACSVQ